MPSQRELSSRFGVSRTSVREALSLLEASGKLRTEPGRRSFWTGGAAAPREELSNSGDAQPDFPAYKTYPKSEISRFRYLIEGQSGRLAAMRITDEEIQQLERNLAVFRTSDQSDGSNRKRANRFRIPSVDRRIFWNSALQGPTHLFQGRHYASGANAEFAVYARVGAGRRAREDY